MNKLQMIFQTFGRQYLGQHRSLMPSHQRKALEAILRCRTIASGYIQYQCGGCEKRVERMCGCGNRNCPLCQYGKAQDWLAKQMRKQLPTHYFMITFTVPENVRRFMRTHQREAYDALFVASSQTLKKFLADPKCAGGDTPGFFGVLHTWGSQLQHHPHIHYIVPGGALADNRSRWVPSSPGYFAHYKNLSNVFRGIFRDEMRKRALLDKIPSNAWHEGWNVNVKAHGGAKQILRYLSHYIFRPAISNHRIVKVEDGRVYFRYKREKSDRNRTMSLEGMEFIRRFLQHALPVGFIKIRHYGFHAGASLTDWDRLRGLVEIAQGLANDPLQPEDPPPKEAMPCPHCKGALAYVETYVPWNGRLIAVSLCRNRRKRDPVNP